MPRWIAFFVFALALLPLSQAGKPLSFEPLFREARQAQRLVSAYDLKLEKIKIEDQLDRLQSSQLYCRIQEARRQSEHLEMELPKKLRSAFRLREERAFFNELFAFARTDSAAAASVGQILLSLAAKEMQICGRKGCIVSLVGDELPFSPFDVKSFADFLQNNRAAIAEPLDPTDEVPGTCFSGIGGANYDWDKRSWISGNLSDGEFVVTYDDGPHAEYTSQIQAAWNSTNYPKPAFFWLSQNALNLKELVQNSHAQGFPVACHSERHADLGNLAKAGDAAALSRVNREAFGEELKNITPAQFPAWKSRTLDREIIGSTRSIEAIIHEVDPSFRLKHFRLPFGSGLKNEAIGDRFSALDVDHFFWRVDSLDWQDKNPASVHQRVVSQMKSGKKGLILFHDIQAPTPLTTKLLLDTFEKTPGWKPVSIRKMVP